MNAPRPRAASSLSGPCARHYALAALGFLTIAIYGSLVPFDYRSIPLDRALERFQMAFRMPLQVISRTDWATNILLFIPLAYLLMGARCVDRPRVTGLLAASIVVPGCAILSAGIEFAQLFFPTRTTSPNDVAAETIGALLGALAWLAWGQRATAWARRLWATRDARGLAAWFLPAYLAFLVLVHLMPMDLSISPAELYHKYLQGRIQPIPFAVARADPLGVATKALWDGIYYFPVGLLMASSGYAAPGRGSWRRMLALGLVLAGLVESLQLFVLSRNSDATDVVIGGLAVLAGWGAGRARSGAWSPPADPTGARRGDASRHQIGPGLGTVRPALLIAWLGVLVVVAWQPFDFTADPAMPALRLRAMSWVPFADYYRGREADAFDQFLHKAILFLPVGALAAPARPRSAGDSAGLLVVLAALGLATVLEAGQFLLPARHPSITDVLVEAWGAWLGLAASRRVRPAPGVAHEPHR